MTCLFFKKRPRGSLRDIMFKVFVSTLKTAPLYVKVSRNEMWMNTARQDWDDNIMRSQARMMKCAAGLEFWSNFCGFDPGRRIRDRSKVTQAMMEWWEAVWGLGELEQNTLIFNPHISTVNLFPENSHAILNYFYVICSKNNQDFFAFLSPTDEKMLTSWKHG